MYQSIGINLSKTLDRLTKKIKVPAVTQRDYYKDLDNIEEEYINFYKKDCNNNNIYDDDEKYNYLDDETDDCNCSDCSCNEDDECFYDECSCFLDKVKNVDSKIVLSASIGALVGCIGMYFILRRK